MKSFYDAINSFFYADREKQMKGGACGRLHH